MPFDANGNFSLVPGTIVADGMNVLPSQHNPPFQDVANGLSQAVVRDGRAPMTGPLNMNGNKITGVAAGDAPDDVVTNAAIAALGVAIGDGKWSVRDLSPSWLRRDGKLYLRSEYPDLAALLPTLPDGIIWENKPSGTANPVYDVAQGSGRFFAIDRTGAGDSNILASVGGGEWTVRHTLEDFFGAKVSYGGGIYVALGGNGHYSQSLDGDIWSSPVLIDTGTVGLSGLAFGDGVFIAAGTKNSNLALWKSSDGVTWSGKGPTSTSGSFRSVEYLGGRFVAVGSGGAVYYSTDGGDTWSSSSTGGGPLYGVSYNGTTYAVVGSGGFIATSSTLSGWTTRTSGTTQPLNAVAASSAGFVAVGGSGVVRISNDGTSWTGVTSGTTSTLLSVIVDEGNPSLYLVSGPPSVIMYGSRTLPTQFRVPTGPEPLYDWIRAL